MYVKISMNYKIRSDLDLQNDQIEDVWIEVTDVNNKSFLLGALCSHANSNVKHFEEILENNIIILIVERKTFHVLGDFNINALSNNTADQQYIKTCDLHVPFRWSPYLQDLCYIKNPHYLTTCTIMTSCMNYSLGYYTAISVITILPFFQLK